MIIIRGILSMFLGFFLANVCNLELTDFRLWAIVILCALFWGCGYIEAKKNFEGKTP